MTRNSDFEYLYEVGRIRSTVFQIGTRADPSVNEARFTGGKLDGIVFLGE